MSATSPALHAILFAEVTGNIRLADNVGEEAAEAAVQALLAQMVATVRRHTGVLVRTLGDEILCHFPSAKHAAAACIRIQEAHAKTPASQQLAIRMGLHCGPVTFDNNDVLGDTVSIAAHLSAIAKVGQILTSHAVVKQLPSQLLSRARPLPHTDPNLRLYELRWASPKPQTEHAAQPIPHAGPQLVLHYQDQTCRLNYGDTATLGRADTCSISVLGTLASRIHARIESHQQQFIFIDQSTNGSYIQIGSGAPVYLRKAEAPLSQQGQLYLGESSLNASDSPIRFEVV